MPYRRFPASGLLGALAAGLLLAGVARAAEEAPAAGEETLTQVSTLQALLDGVYDGCRDMHFLLQRGDLGLGTFDALDGEMIVLDGAVYQVRADGSVRRAPREATTPFACVTPFAPELPLRFDGEVDFDALERTIDAALPTPNLPYAIRLEGTFRHVRTRSVPRQKKPYPPLAEVTKTQPVFERKDVKGVIVGFRLPDYLRGVNVPRYHLHFLSGDRAFGGHLLAFTATSLAGAADDCPRLVLVLPQSEAFGRAGLDAGAEEVRAVEEER